MSSKNLKTKSFAAAQTTTFLGNVNFVRWKFWKTFLFMCHENTIQYHSFGNFSYAENSDQFREITIKNNKYSCQFSFNFSYFYNCCCRFSCIRVNLFFQKVDLSTATIKQILLNCVAVPFMVNDVNKWVANDSRELKKLEYDRSPRLSLRSLRINLINQRNGKILIKIYPSYTCH